MDINIYIKQLKDEIIKYDLKVKSLVKEILDCNSCHEDLNYLISSVSQQIRCHKTSIDKLFKYSKEMTKNDLILELDGFRNQLEANSISLRKAIAFSQKTITSKTREELFGSDQPVVRHRNQSTAKREAMASKSVLITDNLKAVSRQLASQVTQSEHTLQTLVGSSATVTETQEEFKTMGNLIVHSRKLLTKYGRREVTDKVLIILALLFFFGCVLYVMTKRLFWKYS